MPAIRPPAKVLVTGANGFIAAWIVKALLGHGFSVRGTVRAESKSKYLRTLLKSDVDKGRLQFVVVPDMTKPGAFDEAVAGVDATVHCAAPVHLNANDPNEMIEPSVKGALGILESILRCSGPQLKRAIFVSSSGAVINTPYIGTFDENSWNEGSIAEVREKGRNAAQMAKYRASKVLAEKAVWDFTHKNKAGLTWDLVVTCPTYVFGPTLSDARKPSELGTSMFMLYEGVFSNTKSEGDRAGYQSEWSDVRDLAEAHVRALETPTAGGERFLLSKEPYNWLDWCDTVNELKIPRLVIPFGTQGKEYPYRLRFDATKARTILGMEYRYSKSDTARDIISDFKSRGFLD